MAYHFCTASPCPICRSNTNATASTTWNVLSVYQPCEHWHVPGYCPDCYERDRPKGRHEKPKP